MRIDNNIKKLSTRIKDLINITFAIIDRNMAKKDCNLLNIN